MASDDLCTLAFSVPLHIPIAGLQTRSSRDACNLETRRRRMRGARILMNSPVRTSVEPKTSTDDFPLFIPEPAKLIVDPCARAMLRRIQYTSVTTQLEQPDIFTSHCVSEGASDHASPVMFLHGFDSNMLEYRYILPIMDGAPEVEAHFVDILGWGLTEKPKSDTFSYAPDAKREHLRAYQEQVMGDRKMILVGASVGGAAAIDFALQYPDRVQALVLLDSQAFADKKASGLMQAFPVLASWGADVLRSRWLRNIAVALSYENDSFKCEDTLRIGGLHCFSDGWKEAAVSFIIGEGYCISTSVKDVSCPTLVMWGENDRVLPKDYPQKFLDTIPECVLETVVNSGHSPHIEKPDIVAKRVIDFVNGLSS